MYLTASGLVLLPLCLLFFSRPERLLQLAFIAAVFGAAAPVILNLGSPFGLQSGFLPGVFFLCWMGMDYLVRLPQGAEWKTFRALLPMVLFAAYALASALILPRLFEGQFSVWPQRVEFPVAVPLAPDPGNVTQSLYVLMDTTFLVFAALYLSRPGTRHMHLVNAYLAAAYLAVALSLWQFVSKQTGLYYPDDFLYSNPRWGIASTQLLGGLSRINGPFTEPAALSTYMSGVLFACLWLMMRGYANIWVYLLLPLSFLCVWLSTSTTGLIVLAVFAPISLVILLRSAGKRVLHALAVGTCGLLGLALAGYVFLAVAASSFTDHIDGALQSVVTATLDKPESESYAERTTKDVDALAVVAPSYGLGAGWGSLRSSSLIPGILGNTGIPGLTLLCWFALGARALVTRARRLAPAGETRVAMEAMWGSIIGTLSAAVLSAPTIDSIEFYLRLAVLVSAAIRIALDARAPARPAVAGSPALSGLPGAAPRGAG